MFTKFSIALIASCASAVKFAGFDHSKLNASALMPFASVSEIDAIFTDQALAPDLTQLVRNSNVDLHIAKMPDGTG